MRVDYRGRSDGYETRVAYVSFAEGEFNTVVRILEGMRRIDGWKFDIVDTLGIVPVEDRRDYDNFVRAWKKWKKSVLLWQRNGI